MQTFLVIAIRIRIRTLSASRTPPTTQPDSARSLIPIPVFLVFPILILVLPHGRPHPIASTYISR